MRYEQWPAYVSVAEKKEKAKRQIKKLSKKIKDIKPVEIEGRIIAKTFWGKAWCTHLEHFSDYSNRLPRGKSYARHGSICHLEICEGEITAKVSGSSMYDVKIKISPLKKKTWKEIKSRCTGKIGSLIELLQGKISKDVMSVVTEPKTGLLPQTGEIKLDCSCPDWAVMCKHVAAVLYGIGNRLDYEPELLFVLRGVDASELIDEGMTTGLPQAGTEDNSAISEDQLQGMFGGDIDLQLDDDAQRVAEDSADYGANDGDCGSGELYLSGADVLAKRSTLGLTAAGFARQVGVTPATIYRWEKTKKPFKMKKRYADFFR
ncbi:MAG: SWIM zinc finger family protein [Kiritimatiellae bacterium]|nr:SWIM zinc finger family protein [Kiritimatiellia bacterium]